MKPIAVPIPEACAAVGVGRSWMYQLLGRGVLDARKEGRRTLITVQSLQRYVATLPKAKIKTPQRTRISRRKSAMKGAHR